MWTIIGEHGSVEIDGTFEEGASPSLSATEVEHVTGWALKPEGWCRGDRCLLHQLDSETFSPDEIATLLGVKITDDPHHRITVLGHSDDAPLRLEGIAPDIELTTLEGGSENLFEHSDGKTMVVAFSSWCGCRYDLPGWQELQNELADTGFRVVAVAIDDSPTDVTEWAEGIEFPVLVDTNRDFADTYGLTNVPAVVWTDENKRIVRTPTTEFSNDMFTEVHGIESGPHLDAVRAWATSGALPLSGAMPDSASGSSNRPLPAAELSDDQRQARVEVRLALELMRRDHTDEAERRLAIADALAPDDLTIWRAAMKLRGEDTFGAAFFDRFVDWQKRNPVT